LIFSERNHIQPQRPRFIPAYDLRHTTLTIGISETKIAMILTAVNTYDTVSTMDTKPTLDKAVTLRMSVEEFAAIDEWRALQRPIPSRNEAIREIVKAHLAKR
jgi:hypothetical protein